MAFLWNNIRSKRSWIILFASGAVLFNLYFLGHMPLTSYQTKGIFMVLCFILIYIFTIPKSTPARILQTVFLLMAVSGPIWIMFFESRIIANNYLATQADFYIYIVCIIGLAALAIRTTAGIVVVVLMVAGVAYLLFGHFIPGAYGHGFLPPTWVAWALFTNIGEGLFGSLTELGVRLISIFMIFASLLLVSGLGEFFIATAQWIFGGTIGGPAKAAVIGSSLFGMLSGSAVANVSATGSFTIPLMKKVGYTPVVAASTEAVASIGGSLVPPVMGLGAFLMSEIVGVPYIRICLIAVIPAFLWYYSLFLLVHYSALRGRVKRWRPPLDEIKKVAKDTWHLSLAIPILIIALVYFTQPETAAFWSVVALVGLTFINKRTRLNRAKIAEFLHTYARVYMPLLILILCLGSFLGGLLGSGMHLKIGELIMGGVGQWYLALVLVFVLCLMLGMVSPHTVTYIAAAAIVAPPLILTFGFDPIQVHMFIFYAGLLAGLTPPVCLPVFVAASISGAPLMKTGWITALRSLALWIFPFTILRNSLFLGVGTPLDSLGLGVVIIAYGVFIFTLGSAGYFRGDLTWPERALAMAIGVVILQPFFTNEIILGASCLAGLAFIVFRVLFTINKRRRLPYL